MLCFGLPSVLDCRNSAQGSFWLVCFLVLSFSGGSGDDNHFAYSVYGLGKVVYSGLCALVCFWCVLDCVGALNVVLTCEN